MRKIDMFQHIMPLKYKEALVAKGRDCFNLRQIEPHPGLFDLETRFRVIDKHEELQQVLTIATPLVEFVCSPKDAVELSQLCNDELAGLLAKYPDRFVGAVANLPMNDIDAALKEAERAIKDLHLHGIQLTTNINGKPLDSPEFLPFFEMMEAFDRPIWIHPHRDETVADYDGEDISKYGLFSIFGWPYESTLAMSRLVFSGIMEQFPNLKIITHHCGAMIPYFSQRMATIGVNIRGKDPNAKNAEVAVPSLDYFRRFYVDTILGGNISAIMCGYSFYGADHMLFGTDYPFGGKNSEPRMAREVAVLDELLMPPSEREKIAYKNAVKLLKLKE